MNVAVSCPSISGMQRKYVLTNKMADLAKGKSL